MPLPASSFMTGNAPYGASYTAPLVNFGALGDVPDAYFKGTQQARTQRLQQAFPNGLPRDEQGNVDINAIGDTLSKLGGADYASQLMPLLIEQKIGAQAAGAVSDNGLPGSGASPSQPPSVSPSNVPGASGPSNIRGVKQPQLSSVGADNNGSDTVRSIATETFGGRDVSPLIPRFAQAAGVDPDAPLSSDQAGRVKQIISAASQRTAAVQPPNQASDATGGGAPVTPMGGTSGAPAPTGTATPQPQQPANDVVAQRFPNEMQQPAAGPVPGVPQGTDPGGYANALLSRANALHARATSYAALKTAGGQQIAQSMENQAKAYEDRAKQIFDYMGTAQQPTNTMKDVASGADVRTAANQAEAKRSSEVYSGIQGAANQYETGLKPYLDLSRSILNDPRVYTGTGGNFSLDVNKVKALFGNQNAAVLQEALQKVTASSVLSQINQQKNELMQSGGPGSSGRIFQQQVELVEKAAPQLSTTPAGNRFLVEVASRMGDLSTVIRDKAADYLQSHPVLDAAFDKQIATYLKANPIFNKDELTNPALLAAPTAPPSLKTTQERQTWGNGIGLKPGDPFRVNGNYQSWHGGKKAAQQ